MRCAFPISSRVPIPNRSVRSFRVSATADTSTSTKPGWIDYSFKGQTGKKPDGSRDLKLLPKSGDIPAGIFSLSFENFERELKGLRLFVREGGAAELQAAAFSPLDKAGWAVNGVILSGFAALDRTLEENKVLPVLTTLTEDEKEARRKDAARDEIRQKLKSLRLSNEKVSQREKDRVAAGKGVGAPAFILLAYGSLCFLLDVLFRDRPIVRFWFLETVARMPYFSYLTCLHLYESLGWFRAGAELRKIHFGEEYNELNHLLIMESLGGDQLWSDRFVGEHAAVFYYWILVGMYMWSPAQAYNFMALVESHAVDTYQEFLDTNAEVLKTIPPPPAAVDYYMGSDLYIFDLMDPLRKKPRRPDLQSLYNVFEEIRDDEGTHVKIMTACKDHSIIAKLEARKKGNLEELEA